MRRGTALLITMTVSACAPTQPVLNVKSAAALQDSVRSFVAALARDISANGPTAWPPHFVNHPAFFMAADGRMIFPDYAAAAQSVPIFARGTPWIKLGFANVRVDPLSPGIAVLGAEYSEALTDTAHRRVQQSGYMTAVATHSASGWQLRDLHWSQQRSVKP